MIEFPQTLEQAKVHRYNRWGGNPTGTPYREGQCAYAAYSGDRAAMFYQCTRRPVTGPGNLYCKQHAKKVEERNR